MLLNRIYNEQDLERYKNEKEETVAYWREVFKALDLPEDLIEAFSKQVAQSKVPQPKLEGLRVAHTGFSAGQNFSTPFVTEMIQLGIANLQEDRLTLYAEPEDLHYTVLRTPGRWCLHCGEKLPDDINGEMARLHMATRHAGVPSPDESSPAGYVWLTYFECVLDSNQHETFKFDAEVRNG